MSIAQFVERVFAIDEVTDANSVIRSFCSLSSMDQSAWLRPRRLRVQVLQGAPEPRRRGKRGVAQLAACSLWEREVALAKQVTVQIWLPRLQAGMVELVFTPVLRTVG